MIPALINPSRSADHKLRKEWVSCFLDFLFFVGGDPCALSHLYCWTCWVLSLVSPTPPLCKTGRVTTVLRPTHETSSIRTGFYYSNSDIITMWFNEGQKDLLCILFPLAKAFVFYVTIKAVVQTEGRTVWWKLVHVVGRPVVQQRTDSSFQKIHFCYSHYKITFLSTISCF